MTAYTLYHTLPDLMTEYGICLILTGLVGILIIRWAERRIETITRGQAMTELLEGE